MADNSVTLGRNIALLIDADNSSADNLDAVLTILGDLGAVNVRRAYGNWSKATLKGWTAVLHRYAIEPQQQFDLTKGKNATDMKMTIDAMDLLYGGHVDGFGIMSSDSDFMPIVMRLRQKGLPVYGFGSAKAPEGFREACTRFIDFDIASANEKTEKATAKVEPNLVKVLGEAWKASKRDERGYASLSELGQRAANKSSFDARSYGFSRLSELIESLPNFLVERREGGRVFVTRVS